MKRSVILFFSFVVLANQAFADEVFYTAKLVLSDVYDPRHISFAYENGEELSGVHLDVEHSTLWKLEDSKDRKHFNLVYSKDRGLVLKHVSKPVEFRLVGQVTNHPMDRILKDCYGEVGGSSMGIQRCLGEHDKLLDIEIDRAYKMLRDKGQDITDLHESWKEFSHQNYSYIRKFYSKLSGTKWIYRSVEDAVEIDSNHLNILNGWIENLYGYSQQEPKSQGTISDIMYRCFVKPMDEKPDNRLNLMPSHGTLFRLHVSTKDFKTFISTPKEDRIVDIRKSMEFDGKEFDAYSTDHGVLSIFNQEADGWMRSLYQPHGAKGQLTYLCQKVTPEPY